MQVVRIYKTKDRGSYATVNGVATPMKIAIALISKEKLKNISIYKTELQSIYTYQ